MILHKGDKGNIDFSSPIKLDEEQKERLVNFLSGMFYHVELKEGSFRSERLGADNAFNKEWEPEEFELLLNLDENNKEVSRKLGRTWMGVEMKRVTFIPEIMNFAKTKNQDIYTTNMKNLVREFINEHKEEILKRKTEKKVERQKYKEELEELARLPEEITREEKLIGVPGMGFTKESVENKKRRFEELKKELREESEHSL